MNASKTDMVVIIDDTVEVERDLQGRVISIIQNLYPIFTLEYNNAGEVIRYEDAQGNIYDKSYMDFPCPVQPIEVLDCRDEIPYVKLELGEMVFQYESKFPRLYKNGIFDNVINVSFLYDGEIYRRKSLFQYNWEMDIQCKVNKISTLCL